MCTRFSFEDAARFLDHLASQLVAFGHSGEEIGSLAQRGEEASDERVSGTVGVNDKLPVYSGHVHELDGCLTNGVASGDNCGCATLGDDDNTGTCVGSLLELSDDLGDTNAIRGLEADSRGKGRALILVAENVIGVFDGFLDGVHEELDDKEG